MFFVTTTKFLRNLQPFVVFSFILHLARHLRYSSTVIQYGPFGNFETRRCLSIFPNYSLRSPYALRLIYSTAFHDYRYVGSSPYTALPFLRWPVFLYVIFPRPVNFLQNLIISNTLRFYSSFDFVVALLILHA